ncbi:MAG: hypothetical protein CSA36_02705 [Draconibacterium sp.]|nr:MAG: hypothetical protein CSA36_02705 [Draconibacterium sp.]
MRNRQLIYFFLLVAFVLSSCNSNNQWWQQLFNGKNLENWVAYMPSDPVIYDTLATELSVDKIFTTVEIDGVPAIRISGQANASLATKKEFENYHLVVEFKWGDEVFKTRNSGLLFHSFGDFGAGLGVWMSSHECQMWTGNLGDSYRMGKSYCEIPMKMNDEGKYVYTKGAGKKPSIPDSDTKIIAKDTNYENPIGEWNTIELYCYGTTAVHVINGKVNMVIYNSGKYLGDGNISPLTKGKIQFQSEGGELFIKTVKLTPIHKIPENLLK